MASLHELGYPVLDRLRCFVTGFYHSCSDGGTVVNNRDTNERATPVAFAFELCVGPADFA